MQWPDINLALQLYMENAPIGGTMTAEFSQAIPTMIGNAELRIYTDIPFLATRSRNTSLAFTAGSRLLSLAGMTGAKVGGFTTIQAYPVFVEGVIAVVGNTRVPYIRASLEFVDMMYPDPTIAAVPGYDGAWFAALDHQTIVVAPAPDQAYPAVITGLFRPAPMTAVNPETWLGDTYPELFHASVMIEAEGFVRNFGAQAEDPRAAMSWTQIYQGALAAVKKEEALRRGLSPSAAAPPH